jgi:hypothetical protein
LKQKELPAILFVFLLAAVIVNAAQKNSIPTLLHGWI